MGARQSKRSVDITTTPKKGDGEVIAEGDGKVEKLPEIDAKVTTNGAVHTEIEYADKDESGDGKEDGAEPQQQQVQEEIKENGVSESEEAKTSDTEKQTSPAEGGDQLNESTTPNEKSTEAGDNKIEESTENKKSKEKNKKKKWSFRSISFSKKDKSKPSKDSDKNGDVKEVAEEYRPLKSFKRLFANKQVIFRKAFNGWNAVVCTTLLKQWCGIFNLLKIICVSYTSCCV